jgi:di/tricarboxylate transporter
MSRSAIVRAIVAAAVEAGISPKPMLMRVNVAASAALLTPIATPVNLTALRPGGYRFADYARLGIPVLVLFFAIAVFYVPAFWRF